VTEAVRTRTPRLPAAAIRLLDRYDQEHAQVEVRVWSQGDHDGWICLYPETFGSETGPDGDCTALQTDGTGHLVLELRQGRPADVAFLGSALDQVFSYEGEAKLAAHELSERYEEINLLYSISETLASFLSMETASARILEEVADVLGARRAALWVLDPATDRLHLTAAVGDEGLEAPIDVQDETSVTARVYRERQPINLERGERLPVSDLREPRPHGEEPYLSVPVNYTPPDGDGRTVGVITLVGRRTEVRFSAGDLRLLTAIASQVAAALETQRLVQESLRRERIERELELAHDLQLKLLPDASRFGPGDRLAARCTPADSVGGDLYHLFDLPNGRFGVVIADVSSHGFSAALIMALTMSAIAIYAQEADRPGEVLRRLHQALIDELESTEMYLTILFAVIDPAGREIVYANAGHPHAFAIRDPGDVDRLEATSPPLGTFTFPEYGEARVPWDPGDLLLLFTDGLSDAFAGEAGISGEQQLLAEIVAWRTASPAAILDHVFEVAGAGRGEVPPDDRTAVLLRS
jgi:sigma-B regulation protein RsbU (phosphoserine phosphatase)